MDRQLKRAASPERRFSPRLLAQISRPDIPPLPPRSKRRRVAPLEEADVHHTSLEAANHRPGGRWHRCALRRPSPHWSDDTWAPARRRLPGPLRPTGCLRGCALSQACPVTLEQSPALRVLVAPRHRVGWPIPPVSGPGTRRDPHAPLYLPCEHDRRRGALTPCAGSADACSRMKMVPRRACFQLPSKSLVLV